MKIFLFILLLVIIHPSVAQTDEKPSQISVNLENLYSRLLKSSDDEQKMRINDSIRLIISGYAASDTVFQHNFENLRYLGQITSPDSLLKIITWNLILNNGSNNYNLYIIKRTSPDVQSRIYNLNGEFSEEPPRTDTTYSETDWYGALYYDVRPVATDDETLYLLLGLDFGNSLITRKIIEVLSFSDKDSLIFGREWFMKGKAMIYREVLEYSSTAVTILRFVNNNQIVFDHLVPFSPEHANDRRYYGPDYSYDAYEYRNGLWRLRTNVDIRNKE